MLDYTKREKKFLTVTLADGRTVFIGAPKKALFSRLSDIEKDLKHAEDPLAAYDEILLITSQILSNNRAKISFSPAEVDELMDIEDMSLLIIEYSRYAQNLLKNPN